MKVQDIVESMHCGKFEIVSIKNSREVAVRFLNTGYTTTVRSEHVRTRSIKDKLFPTVCGVGCFGVGKYGSRVDGKKTNGYIVWTQMLNRCYSELYQAKRPTYKGCYVCEEWLNFQNFSKWFDSNYIAIHDLDKDILMDGNKVYSPETCSFVTPYDNSLKAQAYCMYTSIVFKGDEVVTVTNQQKFCRERGLGVQNFNAMILGKIKQAYGWRLVNGYT
ncbi:DNA binding protein [Paraglaciecola Antarctic GD virus 1]|nr:DNA binding protein [Paraglaciecola Antarctic GD virus 1]